MRSGIPPPPSPAPEAALEEYGRGALPTGMGMAPFRSACILAALGLCGVLDMASMERRVRCGGER